MGVMADRAEAARALRDEGLLLREIAERLGISLSYASALINDPDGTRARARKMQGECRDCGRSIYSDRPSTSPQERCSRCQHEYKHRNRKWTPERIVAAVQRWAELYGSAPTSSAWNMGQNRLEDRERFYAGDYPNQSQVTQEFGRWSDAIRAAGFEPFHPAAGKPRNSVSEDDYRLMDQLRADGKTPAEIAAHFGVTAGAIHLRFKRRNGVGMATTLKAETVLEREIKRFEDRRDRAEAEAKEAAEQIERLKLALSALSNGTPPAA